MAVDTSNVVVPDNFICPITSELMVDPVKTDCPGVSSSNIIKRISNALFLKSSFDGHVFENLALASWLERNPSCPTCRHRITKIVSDKKTAKKISEQFVNVNEANKEYFNNVKKEQDEDLNNLLLRRNNLLGSQSNLENVKEYLRSCINHPMQTYREILHPRSEAISYLRNNDLDRAEKIVDRGLYFDFFNSKKNTFFLSIAKAYVDRRFSDSNMINAIRIINKISFYSYIDGANQKKELLENIFNKCLNNDSLKITEYVSDIILASGAVVSSWFRAPSHIELVARAYIARNYTDANLDEAKRIVSTKITDNNLKEELNTLIIFKHIENKKYKDAYESVKTMQVGFNRYITYLYLSFFIGLQIPKNISLNIAGAFKNFTAGFKA